MADEPIYFVIERGPGGNEYPAIYYDRLPKRLDKVVEPRVSPLVYCMRLDKLPDCEMWLKMPLAQLYRRYVVCRDRGILVHNLKG